MLVVMQHQASEEQIAGVVRAIREMGLDAHPMPGATRTAIAYGKDTALSDARFRRHQDVVDVLRQALNK